jgi:hypothetical protein
MRWDRHVARMAAIRNAYKILVAKPDGKRLLVRHRRQDNIKMKVIEIDQRIALERIMFLDFVHCLTFIKKQCFKKWICFRLQVK